MSIAASAGLSVPGLVVAPKARASQGSKSVTSESGRKWPFPPMPQPTTATLGDVRDMAPGQLVSRREMLFDILLVGAWGVAIPALMWLGAAAGF